MTDRLMVKNCSILYMCRRINDAHLTFHEKNMRENPNFSDDTEFCRNRHTRIARFGSKNLLQILFHFVIFYLYFYLLVALLL